MLFKNKNKTLLGLDISSSAVKLIELSRSGSSVKVESYAVAPLPDGSSDDKEITDPELVGDSILAALRNSRTKQRSCVLALPPSLVIQKVISLPSGLPLAELESQVEVEAEQNIPYELDEINYDFEVIGPSLHDADTQDVLLVGARSDHVDTRLLAAEAAGLTVEIMDTETHAIETVLRHMTKDHMESRIIGVIDVGAKTSSIAVLEDGVMAFAREQNFGGRQLTEQIMSRYGLSWEEAGLAKKKGDLPDNYLTEVLEPFKEDLCNQIKRFVQFYFAANDKNRFDQLYLSGGCAYIPGLDEQVQTATGFATRYFNPFVDSKLSSNINVKAFNNDVRTLAIAAGLSLRGTL